MSHVLGRPGYLSQWGGKTAKKGTIRAWHAGHEIDLLDPCAGVAGLVRGFSQTCLKAQPGQVQTSSCSASKEPQETMAASGISFQHGGRHRSSFSLEESEAGGSGSCSSGEKGELSLGKVSAGHPQILALLFM